MTAQPCVLTHHLRPLPLPVRPVPRETTSSYLDRLARANRLDSQALRTYLVGSHHKSKQIPVQRLAILSGQDQHGLRHALADLLEQRPDPTQMVRTACRLCAASCQAIGPVTVHLQPQDLVCRNHNRWIGQSWSRRDTQPRLTNHPEITQANKHHRRIIRAHGADAARTAYQARY